MGQCQWAEDWHWEDSSHIQFSVHYFPWRESTPTQLSQHVRKEVTFIRKRETCSYNQAREGRARLHQASLQGALQVVKMLRVRGVTSALPASCHLGQLSQAVGASDLTLPVATFTNREGTVDSGLSSSKGEELQKVCLYIRIRTSEQQKITPIIQTKTSMKIF